MSDITYPNKQVAVNPLFPQPNEKWTAANANEVKTAVNSKVDKVEGYGLSKNNLTDDLLQEIAELKAERAARKEVVITGGGSSGQGQSDSTQFEEKSQQAIEQNRKLIIPAPDNGKYYKLTRTWEMKPVAGEAEYVLHMDGLGGKTRYFIRYAGEEGSVAIRTIGQRHSIWNNIHIALEDTKFTIAYDLDTASASGGNPNRASNTHNIFSNCQIALGGLSGQNQQGWRLGYVSGGGGDISNNKFINCGVSGRYGDTNSPGDGVNDLDIGILICGPNVLANTLDTCLHARLGIGYSNDSMVSGKTGNGATYFLGHVTSQNKLDIKIANSQTYTFFGGRFESGKQVLFVSGGNISPAILFDGVQFDDYKGVASYGADSDRNLFFMDMPASLKLDNCNIKSGQWASYDHNMIRGFGPGGQGLHGSVIVQGGNIQAGDSGFASFGNDPAWRLRIDTVNKLNANGNPIGEFTNV